MADPAEYMSGLVDSLGRGKHDEQFGLKPHEHLDVTDTRQLVAHFVQTTAVHSRTKGWLPMVKVDLTTIPLSGPGAEEVTAFLVDADALDEMARVFAMAAERARFDARIGVLPEPPPKGSR